MNRKETVLISGATGGLGSALTKAFLEEGKAVIALGRDFSKLKEIQSADLHCISCDFLKEDDFLDLQTKISQFEVDTIINAAGTSEGVGAIDSLSISDWKINMEINLFSAVRLNNMVIPQMKSRKSGTIINVTSMAADKPLSWLAPYCVSKAALKHYTMSLSQEMKSSGINVNSLGICADTFLYNQHRKQKEEKGYYSGGSAPQRKMPDAQENVSLFIFLASDKAKHISGQHIECHRDII